jgi:hypothetical protein
MTKILSLTQLIAPPINSVDPTRDRRGERKEGERII